MLRPLIILSYTFAEHHDDTPERWGCEIGTGDNARSLCRDLRAARYLLVPILILAVGLLATALWKRFVDNKHNHNHNNSDSTPGTNHDAAEEAQSTQLKSSR